MNGHWLSGTRKLNKHYQSGQGNSSFVLTGFGSPLMGFEYSGQGERYRWNTGDPRFYSDTTEKVIAAQLYKVCNGLPTSYTLETDVHSLYSTWGIGQSGFYSINTNRRWNANIPVWRYGEFTAEPYWAYDSTYDEIKWGVETVDNQYINQNGIDEQSLPYFYRKGTNKSFENVYDDFEQDIMIPVYEIVAIPSTGSNMVGLYVIMTPNGTFNDTYENKIKVTGYKKAGIERVEGIDTGSNPYIVTPSDGNVYLYTGMSEIYGLCGRNFLGDVIYVPMLDRNGNKIVAGNYTDPDLGITYEMIYYMRLVRLEKARYNMSTRVLPFYIP